METMLHFAQLLSFVYIPVSIGHVDTKNLVLAHVRHQRALGERLFPPSGSALIKAHRNLVIPNRD